MKEHLETLENILDGNLPKNIIADAGYGRTFVFLNESHRKSDCFRQHGGRFTDEALDYLQSWS